MAVFLVLGALLFGVLAHFGLGGRTFTLSAIDLVSVGLFIAGLIRAWRVKRLRLDLAVFGYLGVLAVVGLQVAYRPGAWELVGGSSRFVAPALLLVGLTQFAPLDQSLTEPAADRQPWRWPFAFAAFGAVLAVWVLVLVVGALLDPSYSGVYEVKNAVVMPLGASNYVASFLLVATVVTTTFALHDRRLVVFAIACAVGLVGTLSRGALLAGLLVAGGAVLARRSRRALLIAAGAGVLLLLAVLLATTSQGKLDGVVGGELPGRLALFDKAWETFLRFPLIGVGLNGFDEVALQVGPPHPHAHNLVLNSLAIVGALGTVAYLSLYVLLGWRISRMPAGTARSALALGAAAFVLHAQVEAVAFTRAGEVLLATFLVIAASREHALGVVAFARTSPQPARTVVVDDPAQPHAAMLRSRQ